MPYKIQIISDGSGRYRPRLHIDHQSFTIGEWLEDEDEITGKAHAEWVKKQLKVALERLLKPKESTFEHDH